MKDGGDAFPCFLGEANGSAGGMTLLDWFAGQALHNIARFTVPMKGCVDEFGMNALEGIAWTSKTAYQYAESMIAERERRIRLSEGKKDVVETA